MRRRIAHATRRLPGPHIARLIPRLRERLAPRLRETLRAATRNLVTLSIGLVMLALIGLLLANFVGQVAQGARLETTRVALQTEIAQITADNQRQSDAVDYAESDVNVERIAREQLGYAREGDMVLLPQIPPLTPEPTPIAPTASSAPSPQPNWWLWWQALFPPQQKP